MTSYIVIFGQPVQQMKQTDREAGRQYGNISSIMHGVVEGKLSKNQTGNIDILVVCPCVSEEFKILNHVTLLQIRCKHMMTLGAPGRLRFCLQTLDNNSGGHANF
jgi:hypothetical protein